MGSRRVALAASFYVSCLVAGSVMSRFRGDEQFQDTLATPLGTLALCVLATVTIASLLAWNHARPNRPFSIALLVTTALNLAALLMVVQVGWLSGTAFRSPLAQQLLVYGPGFVAFTGVPLGIYRWVAARSRVLALLVYGGWVLAVSVATVPTLHTFLARGVYVFGHGYDMAWDVGWGIAQYAIALALYEVLARRHNARSAKR